MKATLEILEANYFKLSETLFRNSNTCVLYDRYINSDGYGEVNFRYNNKKYNTLAHRVSYILHHNVNLLTNNIIMHNCDNPTCVNPKHLKLGTHADNVQDRVKKKRSAIGEKNGRYVHGKYCIK